MRYIRKDAKDLQLKSIPVTTYKLSFVASYVPRAHCGDGARAVPAVDQGVAAARGFNRLGDGGEMPADSSAKVYGKEEKDKVRSEEDKGNQRSDGREWVEEAKVARQLLSRWMRRKSGSFPGWACVSLVLVGCCLVVEPL